MVALIVMQGLVVEVGSLHTSTQHLGPSSALALFTRRSYWAKGRYWAKSSCLVPVFGPQCAIRGVRG